MPFIYDTIRGRSRTQIAGVSEKLVRLKDYVIPLPTLPISTPPVRVLSAISLVTAPIYTFGGNRYEQVNVFNEEGLITGSMTGCLETIFLTPMSASDLNPCFSYQTYYPIRYFPNLYAEQGILSWNNGSVYKTSNLVDSFRQRYFQSFAMMNRRTSYNY
jgi:hypothetical protein